MTAFDIDVSSPFSGGFTGGLGGPHVGTHAPPAEWYIEYGMDLGAQEGAEVRAAFDAHLTVFHPHDPATDTPKIYGAQIFMRSPNDMMGGFYTHLKDVPPHLTTGTPVGRGEVLGSVLRFDGTASHLHMAMVEIVGGAPGGSYQGVDNLYDFFQTSANSDTVTPVSFMQDGSPPVLGAGGPTVIHLATMVGVQQGLAVLGYDPGAIDGLDGPNTQAAVQAFQGDQGLPQDGQYTPETLAALAAALTAQGYLVDGP
ncbi:peptidoglycan-binding protein [Streptomyces sp. NPDC056452]|uniref:peptidoglycan-binding protein n=1 Tax=Streptomyces sp. NPDC056452 TaxID=3345821 RepID=UPI0036BF67B5